MLTNTPSFGFSDDVNSIPKEKEPWYLESNHPRYNWSYNNTYIINKGIDLLHL